MRRHVRSPWQKGGVDNTIGRLRRYLPRKTNLNTLSPAQLRAVAKRLNYTPGNAPTPPPPPQRHSFMPQPAHFKRESTSPPARRRQ